MQVVIDALNWISGLGPMCMMPIIMFIIGICLRVKIGTLLKCCITTGVGFCGVNLVINTFLAQVGPSVQAMVANFGLHTACPRCRYLGISPGCGGRLCGFGLKSGHAGPKADELRHGGLLEL